MEQRVSGVQLTGIFTLRVPSLISFGGGAKSGLQSSD